MACSSSSSPPAHRIIKSRWIGFLIWQVIVSTPIYFLSPPYNTAFSYSLLSFLLFSLSLLLFSFSLFLISSPHTQPSSSFAFLLKSALKSAIGGFSTTQDEIFMLKKTLLFVGFFVGSMVSGAIAGMSMTGRVGLGFVCAVVFCCDFVWNRRWVLVFPIVQRPLFYSFKRGIPACIKHAFNLSTLAFLCSLLLSVFLPDYSKRKSSNMGKFMVQLIYSYIASLSISLCWELSYHLLQVVHTRRCSFAPPQGSAAAETNPTELLLEALEQSTSRSLMQYLAYLDLCMVSESNVEPWRRAAFFEESGETYRRIISVCLQPLEQLTSKIGEGLEGSCADKSDLLAQQLNSAATSVDMKVHEAFNDLQICIWCARTLASLTARSHKEDRYGVAQLTNCNIAVVSTLLSSLVAVEACLGKKTSLQPTQIMGPASINWTTANTGRRDGSAATPSIKRGGVLYSKAYVMADVLRTSMYQIVFTFQSDMQANLKASVLEKNWIMDGKPLYSTREILVRKLMLFLDFRAN